MKTRFRAKVNLRGVNPYVLVRADRASRLRPGWRRPMPVLVWINGAPRTPWRLNLVPEGDGSFLLYLNGVVRKATQTAVGDTVDVAAEFDVEYRGGPIHPMPTELAAGFLRSSRVREAWDALPPSRQKEILRYLAALKSPEARRRNVERTLQVLAGGNLRFLGREWNPPA
jgi:hypothetical protein